MLQILKVLDEKRFSGSKARTVVLAQCSTCRTQKEMLQQNVRKSNLKNSERCSHCIDETFHKLTGTRIYRIWQGMKNRSKNQNDMNYGGRGIEVCQEWQDSFLTFYNDMAEGYADHLTIERVDVNKGYSKDNCT